MNFYADANILKNENLRSYILLTD